MSRKLSVGQKLPDFKYDTPFKKDIAIAETYSSIDGRTAIIFLRYYGCTLCQFDIHQYLTGYEEIKKTGGQLLVVLQSDREKLLEQINVDSLPFSIICDPHQVLYNQFEIKAAKSKADMASTRTMEKRAEAIAKGYKHGDYEGEELQLPAGFVVENDGTITYAEYYTAAGDAPSVEELVKLL